MRHSHAALRSIPGTASGVPNVAPAHLSVRGGDRYEPAWQPVQVRQSGRRNRENVSGERRRSARRRTHLKHPQDNCPVGLDERVGAAAQKTRNMLRRRRDCGRREVPGTDRAITLVAGRLRKRGKIRGDRQPAIMADDAEVSDQGLMLQRRTQHRGVVAHEEPGVQEHPEYRHKANQPARPHSPLLLSPSTKHAA